VTTIRPVRDTWPIEAARLGRFVRAAGHRVRNLAPGKWQCSTWSGTHTFTPDVVYAPSSLEELIAIVETCGRAGRRMKPAGGLHSWSPCAVTDDVSLQMGRLNRVLCADRATMTIRAEAGIRLRDLYTHMDRTGLAFPCLPNVDTIQLGGAVSNATHGTCLEAGSMCSLVAELELVAFRGGRAEVLRLRRNTPDRHERHLFEAAVAGIGAVGAIYAVTMRCVEPYHSYVHDRMHRFDEIESRFESLARQHYSVRFMWFPAADLVNTKVQVPIRGPLVSARATTLHNLVDVLIIWLFAFGNMRQPTRWRRLRYVTQGWMKRQTRRHREKLLEHSRGKLLRWTDAELDSRLHAAVGASRFVNLEYAVPLDRCDETVNRLRVLFARFGDESKTGGRAPFVDFPPVGFRPVGPDDAGYLAAPKGQAVAYFDIPYIADVEATGLYAAMERTFIALGGRCSWSRLAYATPEEFLQNYPEHHRFVDAKRELDPDNVFSNEFSDRICEALGPQVRAFRA
jgi:L-gulonolactone oxidase